MAINAASLAVHTNGVSNEFAFPKPPEIVALYAKLNALLISGDPGKALALAQRTRLDSPWVPNAVGVCQLRLGHVASAVELFRGMVVSGHLDLRDDVPVVWKTNFATALLMAKNLAGCLAALAEIKDHHHPHVAKIRAAVERWKAGLS